VPWIVASVRRLGHFILPGGEGCDALLLGQLRHRCEGDAALRLAQTNLLVDEDVVKARVRGVLGRGGVNDLVHVRPIARPEAHGAGVAAGYHDVPTEVEGVELLAGGTNGSDLGVRCRIHRASHRVALQPKECNMIQARSMRDGRPCFLISTVSLPHVRMGRAADPTHLARHDLIRPVVLHNRGPERASADLDILFAFADGCEHDGLQAGVDRGTGLWNRGSHRSRGVKQADGAN